MEDKQTPTSSPLTDADPGQVASTTDSASSIWLTRYRWLLAGYWLALATITHWPKFPVPNQEIATLRADVLLHLLAFGILAWLIFQSRLCPSGSNRPVRGLITLVIACSYALVDEWTQQFVGRVVGAGDVLANMAGIAAVAYVMGMTGWRAEEKEKQPLSWRAKLFGIVLIFTVIATIILLLVSRQTVDDLGFWFRTRGIWRDKIAHYLVAGLVLILWHFSRWPVRHRPGIRAGVIALVLLAAGPMIEIVQSLVVPIRGNNVADMAAHTLGVVAGMTIVLCLEWALSVSRQHAIPRLPVTTGPIDADSADLPAADEVSDEQDASRSREVEPVERSESFVGHAKLVSLLTLLSRFAGLARDAILAAVFGLSSVADAFFIAFLIPNLFRRLFGEGALSAALVPHYAELIERDPPAARQLAWAMTALLIVVTGGLTLLGIAVLFGLLSLGGWSAGTALTLKLSMLMLPYMPLICIVAIWSGMLNVHKRFALPALVPVILNGCIIAVAATTGLAQRWPAEQTAFAVGGAIVVAGLLQLLLVGGQLLTVAPVTRQLRQAAGAVRDVIVMMGPMTIGLAVFQINALMDSLIAYVLSDRAASQPLVMLNLTIPQPLEPGAVAALQWAQRLYQFPLGVFGIAIATAIFPALARSASRLESGDTTFRNTLQQGLRLAFYIGLPATVGLMLVREPAVRLLFERGKFETGDSVRVAGILLGYASAIWAYTMMHVLTRAHYAVKDAATPWRLSLAAVGINLILNLTLIWPLGAAGLAWSTAATAALQVALLWRSMAGRVGPLMTMPVRISLLRTGIAAGAMLIVLLPIGIWVDFLAMDTMRLLVGLILMMVLAGAVFVVVSRALKAEELGMLFRR